MSYLTKNDAYSTLSSSISALDTVINVQAGHGDRFPTIVSPDYTKLTLENAAGEREIILVSARASASDSMTVQRGQEGTTARAWASGSIVECRLTSGLVQEALAHAADLTDAHTASAITNVPSGNIISTTVQAAINLIGSFITSLTSSIAAHINNTAAAHAASSISYNGGLNTVATDVEGALDEIATDVYAALDATYAQIAIIDAAIVGVSKAEAEAGTLDNGRMTPLRVKEAIVFNRPTQTVSTSAPSGGVDGDIWYQY